MSISANVTTNKITASVVSSGVSASVSTSSVTASASGGVGPQGPVGPQATFSGGLADLSDVALASVQAGDVLRYSSNKWRNHAETGLVDGGNFG